MKKSWKKRRGSGADEAPPEPEIEYSTFIKDMRILARAETSGPDVNVFVHHCVACHETEEDAHDRFDKCSR